jgi:hypothetical protein
VAVHQGDYTGARALNEESQARFRELGDRQGIADSVDNLGLVAERQGNDVAARTLYKESLVLRREVGDQQGIAVSLEEFARLAGAQGQPGCGAQLWGAADALREALGAPRPPNEIGECEQAFVALRSTLGEEGFAAAWAAGRALSLEEAIALALEADAAPTE